MNIPGKGLLASAMMSVAAVMPTGEATAQDLPVVDVSLYSSNEVLRPHEYVTTTRSAEDAKRESSGGVVFLIGDKVNSAAIRFAHVQFADIGLRFEMHYADDDLNLDDHQIRAYIFNNDLKAIVPQEKVADLIVDIENLLIQHGVLEQRRDLVSAVEVDANPS